MLTVDKLSGIQVDAVASNTIASPGLSRVIVSELLPSMVPDELAAILTVLLVSVAKAMTRDPATGAVRFSVTALLEPSRPR